MAQLVENFSPGIGHPSDQPGDVYVTAIAVPSQPGLKMPCDLDRTYKSKDGTPTIMNLIFRGQFFHPDPSGEDALLYWARTGRCIPE